jgi:hypothetical protein
MKVNELLEDVDHAVPLAVSMLQKLLAANKKVFVHHCDPSDGLQDDEHPDRLIDIVTQPGANFAGLQLDVNRKTGSAGSETFTPYRELEKARLKQRPRAKNTWDLYVLT